MTPDPVVAKVIDVMTAMQHISFESAKRFGDWCVGGRREYQAINPTPAEALV